MFVHNRKFVCTPLQISIFCQDSGNHGNISTEKKTKKASGTKILYLSHIIHRKLRHKIKLIQNKTNLIYFH